MVVFSFLLEVSRNGIRRWRFQVLCMAQMYHIDSPAVLD